MRRRSRRPSGLVPAVVAALLLLLAVSPSPARAIGSDPGLPQQWALRQIKASDAWATSVGAGVPIAIIDTGIEKAHEDLRDQLAAAVTCVGTGGDPSRCTTDGADIQGHGSHVAGIAAAASNSAGVAGVAPGARIVAVRVFTESKNAFTGEPTYGANTDDINAGIRWAIRNIAGKGAINLSLGDDFPIALGSSGFESGIEEAWAAGWVPVLAAGNEGNLLGLNGEEYGAMNALVVGATGPDGEIADYSSPLGSAKWGLVAPGGNAHAAGSKGACQNEPARCVLSTYKGGEYGLLQGTSMATPHVAGAVALVMASGLANAAAVQRLLATADKSRDCGGGCKGRLDVAAAIAGLPPSAGSTGAASGAGTGDGGGGSGGTTGSGGDASGGAASGGSGSGGSGTTSTAATRRAAPGAATTTAAPPTASTDQDAGAAAAAASAEAEAAAAAAGAAASESTTPPPTTADDAVTGLSVEEAADVADGASSDVPAGWAVAAVLAIGGAGGTALFAWRRRWGATT